MSICNKCFVHELCNELNTNVVLFTVDGFATLGTVQQVIDNRVVVLTPATSITGVTTVRTLGPGGVVSLPTTFVNIDVCAIVAKATALPTAAPPF